MAVHPALPVCALLNAWGGAMMLCMSFILRHGWGALMAEEPGFVQQDAAPKATSAGRVMFVLALLFGGIAAAQAVYARAVPQTKTRERSSSAPWDVPQY